MVIMYVSLLAQRFNVLFQFEKLTNNSKGKHIRNQLHIATKLLHNRGTKLMSSMKSNFTNHSFSSSIVRILNTI